MPDPIDPNRDQDILRHAMPPKLKFYGLVGVGIAAAIALGGLALRYYGNAQTENWTADQAIQSVQTIALKSAKAGGDMILPGDIQAFTNAPLYAQVSGYVKKWYVDIGTPVKKGQLLAEIDTPQLDGQLAQAQSALVSAQANQQLSAATARRWDSLFAQGAVSRQDKEEKDADLAAKNAAVAAARAGFTSLRAQTGFKRLIAPFDGIVTSRSVDVGNLVSVGNSATPLFTVTDQTRLRIYVRVPQASSDLIKPGMTITFTVPEYPGRVFTAQLSNAAGAVQSQSGTQLVQFQIDNGDGALKPGSYAEVHMTLPSGAHILRVPATALMFRESGMLVATVDRTNHVALKPIVIRADLGNAVEVGSGLSPSDKVIDNPPDALRAGDLVRPLAASRAQPTDTD